MSSNLAAPTKNADLFKDLQSYPQRLNVDGLARDMTIASAEASKPTVFNISAIWDDEGGVFYSLSDIPGLHVESQTFDEFVSLVRDLAPDVVAQNMPMVSGPFSISISAQRALTLTAA